jgi:protein tyrosine/serine phosphatase
MSNGEYQTVDVFDEGAQQESIKAVMAADPSYLLASFSAIEKVYGSFDNYITEALILTDSELNQLSHLLSG